MSAFDTIIGYEGIKNELKKICDMIENKKKYEKLGANLPKGILIAGNPGLGKTIMAKALIEETGLQAFAIRPSKGGDEFIDIISNTFEEAKINAPSIVFMDDMDKFGNEDGRRTDCEEYVAIQSAMDDSQAQGVLVIATVNEKHKLPDSLLRAGRFDWEFNVSPPTGEEAMAIIKYYLSKKKVTRDINYDDINKMLTYSSCAELEAVVNEAAIHAGYNNKKTIDMDDIVFAVLRHTYKSPEVMHSGNDFERKRTAIHEAGHTVVSEVLLKGSVGLTSIRSKRGRGVCGFMHNCKPMRNYAQSVMVGLGGKCAVELFLGNSIEKGASRDLNNVMEILTDQIEQGGVAGHGFLDIPRYGSSEEHKRAVETAVNIEMERYSNLVKDILLANRAFFDQVVDSLLTKETLLYSDIQKIRSGIRVRRAV